MKVIIEHKNKVVEFYDVPAEVANSCSTMHKIQDKEFTLEDFSCEHMSQKCILEDIINELNTAREYFNKYDTLDDHFKNEEFDKNIPVVLALLSIWYNNFFKVESEAVVAYSQYLNKLVPYLQQAIMESNGKNIDRNGDKINYQTGTIVWGNVGSNSQHAYFQLLHQGTKLIPTDFIGFSKPLLGNFKNHNILMANYLAQTEALWEGTYNKEVEKPFKFFEGNKPTNSILIKKLTPNSLGKLIAMYEHKLFVQGIIWNIFSYDQWGVELGKTVAKGTLSSIENKNATEVKNPSTQNLIKKLLDS